MNSDTENITETGSFSSEQTSWNHLQLSQYAEFLQETTESVDHGDISRSAAAAERFCEAIRDDLRWDLLTDVGKSRFLSDYIYSTDGIWDRLVKLLRDTIYEASEVYLDTEKNRQICQNCPRCKCQRLRCGQLSFFEKMQSNSLLRPCNKSVRKLTSSSNVTPKNDGPFGMLLKKRMRFSSPKATEVGEETEMMSVWSLSPLPARLQTTAFFTHSVSHTPLPSKLQSGSETDNESNALDDDRTDVPEEIVVCNMDKLEEEFKMGKQREVSKVGQEWWQARMQRVRQTNSWSVVLTTLSTVCDIFGYWEGRAADPTVMKTIIRLMRSQAFNYEEYELELADTCWVLAHEIQRPSSTTTAAHLAWAAGWPRVSPAKESYQLLPKDTKWLNRLLHVARGRGAYAMSPLLCTVLEAGPPSVKDYVASYGAMVSELPFAAMNIDGAETETPLETQRKHQGFAWFEHDRYLMKEIVVTCSVDDHCAICLELLTEQTQVYSKGQPVRLQCDCRKFRFHELCLRNHLLNSKKCPMCRGAPKKVEQIQCDFKRNGWSEDMEKTLDC